MTSIQNQKSDKDLSLSFDDVSKLFSLPLSEAADILGVSTSALKKLCNEHGLERWPHRKYLAGKSIEEIKKEAAKEKSKAQGGNSPADRQKSNGTTGPAVSSSPGSHVKDKTPKSSAEMSKSQNTAQPSGNKNIYTWRPHHILAPGLPLETSAYLDEFKFGFPSNGLSRSINKWWGSASDDQDKVSRDELQKSPRSKQAPEAQEVEAAVTTSAEKEASEAQVVDDPVATCAEKDGQLMEVSSSDVPDNVVSLYIARKRAVHEGRQALKLGLLKKHRSHKLGEEEKILFRRLFQTSFQTDSSATVLSDANKVGDLEV